jgi:hypothetical protein
MPAYTLRGIGPPFPKQQKLIDWLFRPDPDHVKQGDLCCGRGFGKSVVAIDIAVRALSRAPNQVGLFLEPDWKRVKRVFLRKWQAIVPPELYTLNKGEQCIYWKGNGSRLYYSPRNITGSHQSTEDSELGLDTHFVIDDEAAMRCSFNMYVNNMGTIRLPGTVRFYLTVSTPRVGDYKRLVTSEGHTLFRGRSDDNPYRPKNYVADLTKNMSEDQARRELAGEFITLRGKIWPEAKWHKNNKEAAWPNGNRNDEWTEFRPSEPWWLYCDLGSATGAYAVIQRANGVYRGRPLFPGPVWVAVADLCPHQDASAARAFSLLDSHFGRPLMVVAGNDVNTRSTVDGRTVSYFAKQIWGNVIIKPCAESLFDKQLQYDKLSYLIQQSGTGHRRFTIARDFVSLDKQSKRGIREMIEEDEWPEESKRRPQDFLPKGKEVTVQHIRDALLMGAVMHMSPPRWAKSEQRAA